PKIPALTGPHPVGSSIISWQEKYKFRSLLSKDSDPYSIKYATFYLKLWYPISKPSLLSTVLGSFSRAAYLMHPKDQIFAKRIFPNKQDLAGDGYSYALFISKKTKVNSYQNKAPLIPKNGLKVIIYS